MKKNYFFSFLLVFFLSYTFVGQVISAEGFSYADGSLVPNGGWAREGGTSGDFLVNSGQAVVQHGAPSEDVKLAFSEVQGDVYVGFDFSVDDLGEPYSGSDNEYFAHLDFKARIDIVPPTGQGDYSVGISSASSTAEATWGADLMFGTTYRAIIKFDQVTGTAQLWVNPSQISDASIAGSESGAFNVKEFELRQSDSSENETVRVDNLMIGQTFNDVLVFVAPTNPTLSIGGVSNNQVFSPIVTDVSVTVSVQNFTFSKDNGSGMSDGSGDGYIKATLDVIGQTDPVTNFFDTNLPNIEVEAGKTYTLTIELVDNSGNSLNPKLESTVSFSVATSTNITDIAALRAGTEGEYYTLTGEVILTYARESRNQKYIQDASAGILIDDSAGAITTTYNTYDGITGIQGRLGSFGGVLQFIPTADSGAATSTGNTITPEVVSLADFVANSNNYESELIQIDDVSFTDAGSTFETSTNYEITSGQTTSIFRTNFSEADYIGTTIPSGSNSMAVLGAEFNGTPQVIAINLEGLVLSADGFVIDGFSIFPNPVTNGELTITSKSSNDKAISIYNVLGKQVFSDAFSGTLKTLNLADLSSGIYILKVAEGGKIATKKLVIK